MLTSRVRSWLPSVVVAVIITLLPACTSGGGPIPAATIKYHQVGACNGYVQGSNAISAGVNSAYVVFKIEAVDNTPTSIDFHFDPTHLFLDGHPGAFVNTGLMFAQDLGVIGTVPVTVPHGTTMGLNGFSVAVVSTSSTNGSAEAHHTVYNLLYDKQPADPGFLMARTNTTQTNWPQTDDCRLMILQ